MSKILIALVLGLFTTASFALSAQQENVALVINANTTMDDLVNIKMELLEKGALFNMYDLTFTDEGTVSKISIKVDFGDGHKGSASLNDFNNGKSIHIIRQFDNPEKPFCVGECKEYEVPGIEAED